MGLYDRDYLRESEGGYFASVGAGGRSMVVTLIMINVGVYVVSMILGERFVETISLSSDVFREPWMLWTVLTYGFVHDTHSLAHIFSNMLALFFFGRAVESVTGPREFLRFYLTAVVLAALAWLAGLVVFGSDGRTAILMGASGAVVATVILFVCHFPRQTVLLFFVLPVPAWVIGILYVAYDFMRLQSAAGGMRLDNVAFEAHLAGALFGFLYYRFRWNLGRVFDFQRLTSWTRRRPKLRVHRPSASETRFEDQVDRILEKISREGEASLTASERRTLQEASRRAQRRRS